MNQPFWTDKLLPVPAFALWEAVLAAHDASTRRDNVSAHVVAAAALGSGDYTKSIAAGLMTLGGVHAPIKETMSLLRQTDPENTAKVLLGQSRKVPGWGSSFHRGEPDPLWTDVDALLLEEFPNMATRLSRVTQILHENGKVLYPNPSAYTAACALILKMPSRIAPYLFIAGRLSGWSKIVLANTK